MASLHPETAPVCDRTPTRQWWANTDDAAGMIVLSVRLGVHPQIVMSQMRDAVKSLDLDDDAAGLVRVLTSWVHGRVDTEDVVHELDIYEATNAFAQGDMNATVVRAVGALLSWWLAVFCGEETAHPAMLTPLRECYWAIGEIRGHGEMALAVRRGIPYACLATSWVARLTGEDMNQATG